MAFLKNVVGVMTDAKDYVVEKNKRAAAINKLRQTIKKEKMKADKAYIALGRYYFHNLRDISNIDTELNCKEIEEAESLIEQSALHLEKIYNEDMIKKEARPVVTNTEYADTTDIVEINSPIITGQEDEFVDGIVDEAVPPQE